MNKRLSIVIPVQEHDCLGDTLEALANQAHFSRDEYEIIVTDSLHLIDCQGIVDSTLGRHPDLCLRFLSMPKSGCRARLLNAGMNTATADLLLLLADDFIPQDMLLFLHLQAHQKDPDPNLVAMGPGFFRTDSSTTEFMLWMERSGTLFGVPFARKPYCSLPDQFFYMANTSLYRSLLAKAGPFDEDFPYDALDDMEMGQRLYAAGMRTVYLPQAIAIHENSISLQDRCVAMEKAGESAAIYDAKHVTPGPWIGMVRMPRLSHAARKRNPGNSATKGY